MMKPFLTPGGSHVEARREARILKCFSRFEVRTHVKN